MNPNPFVQFLSSVQDAYDSENFSYLSELISHGVDVGYIGTLSHGTCKVSDLWPRVYDLGVSLDLSLPPIPDGPFSDESEEDMHEEFDWYYFEELFPIVKSAIPCPLYLGMHEGDASDLGIWLMSDFDWITDCGKSSLESSLVEYRFQRPQYQRSGRVRVGHHEFIVSAGSDDRIYCYRVGDHVLVLSVYYGLPYVGLEVFDTTYSHGGEFNRPLRDIFLQGDHVFENVGDIRNRDIHVVASELYGFCLDTL
jgi:hypothetical protein